MGKADSQGLPVELEWKKIQALLIFSPEPAVVWGEDGRAQSQPAGPKVTHLRPGEKKRLLGGPCWQLWFLHLEKFLEW